MEQKLLLKNLEDTDTVEKRFMEKNRVLLIRRLMKSKITFDKSRRNEIFLDNDQVANQSVKKFKAQKN